MRNFKFLSLFIFWLFSFNIVHSQTITTSISSLSSIITCEGSASATRNFTVEGSSLTDDITLSVSNSTYIEISTSSGSGYSNSLVLAESGGSVATTTIYARIKSI